MILIVGLGNPGEKFKKTRHNLGFIIIDEIVNNFQFSIFNFQSIFNAQITKGKIGNKKIILAKPQTFMNESGKSIKKIIENYKLKIENLIIIHDEIDLPLGKIRISVGKDSAGHKGVQSIIDELKTKNFIRLRIGIKNPVFQSIPKKIDKFVLEKFSRKEEKILKEVIKKTIEAIETLIKEGVEKAMTKYNK